MLRSYRRKVHFVRGHFVILAHLHSESDERMKVVIHINYVSVKWWDVPSHGPPEPSRAWFDGAVPRTLTSQWNSYSRDFVLSRIDHTGSKIIYYDVYKGKLIQQPIEMAILRYHKSITGRSTDIWHTWRTTSLRMSTLHINRSSGIFSFA